jgi:hypothetical protein
MCCCRLSAARYRGCTDWIMISAPGTTALFPQLSHRMATAVMIISGSSGRRRAGLLEQIWCTTFRRAKWVTAPAQQNHAIRADPSSVPSSGQQ